jgi:nucleotide-binding universal stress UspA family protein
MARGFASTTMGPKKFKPKEAVMFTKIVWATDGSANADEALPIARSLAEAAGGRIFAVHCTEVFVGRSASGLPVPADEEERQEKIRGQVAELRAAGLKATLLVVVGASSETARLLAKTAGRVDADVIVTGTRGHGLVTGAIVGSVTQRLLHLAPCPVLTVPPAQRPARRRMPETGAVGG